ncbi:MAG TPA: GspMb/PilO family protein [Silvibacterium sp.]|nr:GspMb/PilO family protein [Silvibacterium sp.]
MSNLRRFFTVLNLHIACAVLLGGLVFLLGVKVILAFHAAGEVDSASYQREEIRVAQLRSQMGHLEGLPEKVIEARNDGQKFFDQRIAQNYSTIVEELGAASVKNQVRLTRAQYTPKPATDALTELRIDANLSGDYTALMHFINDLERDKNHVFFIIDGLTFTGQQGGLVNLRLRLTTYLRTNPGEQPPANEGDESARVEDVSREGER